MTPEEANFSKNFQFKIVIILNGITVEYSPIEQKKRLRKLQNRQTDLIDNIKIFLNYWQNKNFCNNLKCRIK